MDAVNAQYDRFEKLYANSEYLADIDEDVLYANYKAEIRMDHKKDFANFSQLHRDAFLRLKLREISYISDDP